MSYQFDPVWTRQILYIHNDSRPFLCFQRKDLKTPQFFVNDSKIPLVEQCRYLGTTISINIIDLDLHRQVRKIYINGNLLSRQFSKCSINVKCYLFKTYCNNLYCAPMWFDCTKTALAKLNVANNNGRTLAQQVLGASEMFVNFNIKSLQYLIHNINLSLVRNCQSHWRES